MPLSNALVNSRFSINRVLTSDAASGSGVLAVTPASHTLLVVDDDRSVRQALWVTFRDLYEVHLAESGAAAMQMFREHPTDVVLLDIHMPVMNGLEVLKKAKEADPDVEVLLLTGYETIEYMREAMRLGASEYI